MCTTVAVAIFSEEIVSHYGSGLQAVLCHVMKLFRPLRWLHQQWYKYITISGFAVLVTEEATKDSCFL